MWVVMAVVGLGVVIVGKLGAPPRRVETEVIEAMDLRRSSCVVPDCSWVLVEALVLVVAVVGGFRKADSDGSVGRGFGMLNEGKGRTEF